MCFGEALQVRCRHTFRGRRNRWRHSTLTLLAPQHNSVICPRQLFNALAFDKEGATVQAAVQALPHRYMLFAHTIAHWAYARHRYVCSDLSRPEAGDLGHIIGGRLPSAFLKLPSHPPLADAASVLMTFL